MSNLSGISNQTSIKGLGYAPETPTTTTKRFEGGAPAAGQDPALVAWFEQANAYYNAVMAGDPSTPQPTEAEWNDFLAQLQWAQQQLGYGAGGAPGTMGMVGGGYGAPQGPQSNQFGGMSGTMDNWVYTNAEAEIGFTGNGTHDIWSNDVTINVAPVSGHVTIEQTTDTRFQPNEQVTKVVVTDPATGTEAVYFLHDFDPNKEPPDTLKITTPEEGQVTNNSGWPEGVYSWEEFQPGGSAETASQPDASIEGEKIDENTYLYEPEFAGETVNFWANPNGADATEPQVHTVYADANINVKPSDEVAVAMNGDVMVVTVTHSDGSTDVYNIQKGYNANINQKAEYVTVGGDPATDGIPDAFAERLTLNGAAETTEAGEGAVDADAMIEELKEMTGLDNDNQLVGALRDHGFLGASEGIEELKEKMTSEPPSFPPSPPTLELIQFLESIDVGNDGLKEALAESSTNTDPDKVDNLDKAVTDRLIELLQSLYPNEIVSKGSGNNYTVTITGSDYEWGVEGGDISFGAA